MSERSSLSQSKNKNKRTIPRGSHHLQIIPANLRVTAIPAQLFSRNKGILSNPHPSVEHLIPSSPLPQVPSVSNTRVPAQPTPTKQHPHPISNPFTPPHIPSYFPTNQNIANLFTMSLYTSIEFNNSIKLYYLNFGKGVRL